MTSTPSALLISVCIAVFAASSRTSADTGTDATGAAGALTVTVRGVRVFRAGLALDVICTCVGALTTVRDLRAGAAASAFCASSRVGTRKRPGCGSFHRLSGALMNQFGHGSPRSAATDFATPRRTTFAP